MARTLSILLCVVFIVAGVWAQGNPPPAPTNLAAQFVAQYGMPSVKLTWNTSDTTLAYYVYRSQTDTSHFRFVGSAFMTNFVDNGVRLRTTYNYRVTSVSHGPSHGRESTPSNVATITTPDTIIRVQGTIAGTVIDDSASAPLRNAMVQFYRIGGVGPQCGFGPGAITDSLGHFSALLDTGSYLMRTDGPMAPHFAPRFVSQWYNNAPDPQHATPIAVVSGQTFTADVRLARYVPPTYVYLSGTVSDSLGNPLRNATVSVTRTVQGMNYLASVLGIVPGNGPEGMILDGIGYTRGVMWNGRTDSAGHYRAHLIAGQSYIAMGSKQGYLPQWFDHKTTATDADIIQLGNHDTTGFNFNLYVKPVPQNSVSGIVKDSLGTRVPSRITIFALTPTPGYPPTMYGHTDSLGAYTIDHVPAGKYFVMAFPFSGYAPAYFKAGAYGVMHREDADTVTITGAVTGVDVGVKQVLSNGIVRVTGTIRTMAGGSLEGVAVLAMSNGAIAGYGLTDTRGNYEINSIAGGGITVVTERQGYQVAQSNIVINAGTYSVSNVNLSLSPTSLTGVSTTTSVPVSYALNQNYPNPFNPTTTISYVLPAASKVQLKVYNLLGQEVATLYNGEVQAGTQHVVWNGKDNSNLSVASGIYFYKLSATPSAGGSEFSSIRKMVLLK